MSDAISSRPVTGADLDAVPKIEYTAFSRPWACGIFNKGLKDYHCWLMFRGSQQVGHGVIQIVLDEARLLNITVKPESRRRGLGLRLLKHLVREAAGHQARECFLEVCASSQVVYRFYERYGFNRVSRRRDYYPVVDERKDILVMTCTLFS